MTDLTKIEARIVALCERAKAKGWRFTAMCDGDGLTCGCPLQFAAREMGIQVSNDKEDPWVQAGKLIGVRSVFFGSGFDAATMGFRLMSDQEDYRLGARLARRFVDGVGS